MLRPVSKKIVIVSLLLAVAACNSTSLPEKCPDDLVIYLSYSGGMSPEGHSMRLSKDSCIATYTAMQEEHHARFQLDAEEWKQLWSVFRTARFDRISSHEEEIYDRGGTSLTISWKGRDINQSDAGMTVVDSRSAKRFQDCVNAVYGLSAKKIEAQKKKVTLIAGENLFNDSTVIYVQMDFESLLPSDSLVKDKKMEVRLLPGSYKLQCNYFLRSRQQYNQKLVNSPSGSFSVASDVVYRLQLQEGQLVLVAQ